VLFLSFCAVFKLLEFDYGLTCVYTRPGRSARHSRGGYQTRHSRGRLRRTKITACSASSVNSTSGSCRMEPTALARAEPPKPITMPRQEQQTTESSIVQGRPQRRPSRRLRRASKSNSGGGNANLHKRHKRRRQRARWAGVGREVKSQIRRRGRMESRWMVESREEMPS
jgi:hypothetical protein